ncbi:hypothetical protein [Pseudomonas brassicacearum]|uniref:hypothetical protein n=1 Tax=Pseudomonas brassicacearum TaxID=930166 RepID=UPI0021821F30|nr:hypothetical protein [Pseudomonas brassicacearum]
MTIFLFFNQVSLIYLDGSMQSYLISESGGGRRRLLHGTTDGDKSPSFLGFFLHVGLKTDIKLRASLVAFFQGSRLFISLWSRSHEELLVICYFNRACSVYEFAGALASVTHQSPVNGLDNRRPRSKPQH